MKLIKHVKHGIGWFSNDSDWTTTLENFEASDSLRVPSSQVKTIDRCTTCARMDDTDCTPLSQQYDFLVSYSCRFFVPIITYNFRVVQNTILKSLARVTIKDVPAGLANVTLPWPQHQPILLNQVNSTADIPTLVISTKRICVTGLVNSKLLMNVVVNIHHDSHLQPTLDREAVVDPRPI